MTGLGYTLIVAFIAAVGIAAWFARLTAKITSWQRILWTKHEKLMSAAVDLDLQVSDCLSIIDVADADMALDSYLNNACMEYNKSWYKTMARHADELKAELVTIKETLARKNIDFAKLDADYEALGVQFESVMKNHTLTKICHKCKVRMPKATPLVDGVYTCAKCNAKIAETTPTNTPEPFDSTVAVEYMQQGRVVEAITTRCDYYAWFDGSVIMAQDKGHIHESIRQDIAEWVKLWCCDKFTLVTPADLTNAPFEGLEGVKEGDSVLFSDGTIRTVSSVGRDIIYVYHDGYGNNYGLLKRNGYHQEWYAGIRAIRLATPLDMKLYQFAEGSKMIEKPAKPLLADAKVGDLCKLKNGKWVQIVRIVNGMPYQIVYVYDEIRMHIKINGKYGFWDSNYDIIATEPLATEGSAEWAWQMMLLGDMVCNSEHIEGGHYEMINNVAYFTNKLGIIKSTCTKHTRETWEDTWKPIKLSWQIYSEGK